MTQHNETPYEPGDIGYQRWRVMQSIKAKQAQRPTVDAQGNVIEPGTPVPVDAFGLAKP